MTDSIDHQKNEDFAQVFGTPKGQIVLRDIIDYCGLLTEENPPTLGEEINWSASVLGYYRGRRSVIKYILNRTNWDLDPKFIRKQSEAASLDYQR